MTAITHKDALSLEGKCIDKYRFSRLLERGENVFVYLGYDMCADRVVAIKVVHDDYADEARLQLLNEQSLFAKLVHPHIVRMLDFIVTPPFTLLVTEYADGGSLRTCLKAHTKPPLSTRAMYITQAAEALQYMHDHGYIHRDVKPENILLTLDGSVQLCDLGISVPIRNDGIRINSMGTASYVAPEQIQGYPSQKSDQYSLATVAYELFCGMRPFAGSSDEHLVWKQIALTSPPLHSRCKKLSSVTEQIIMQALAKEPDQRFSRIETFAQEFCNSLDSSLNLSNSTNEFECLLKVQKTTDCESHCIHTSNQHLLPPDTASLG